MAAVIVVGIMILVFKPRWLDDIQPVVPSYFRQYEEDKVYPPSKLTARTLNSSQRSCFHGEIMNEKDRSREAQAWREARKAHTREEMGEGNKMAMLEAKAERRAAVEAKHIQAKRRQDAAAAFAGLACNSPTWLCDQTHCANCPYARS
jgi:hypothetical protein